MWFWKMIFISKKHFSIIGWCIQSFGYINSSKDWGRSLSLLKTDTFFQTNKNKNEKFFCR
eukprot:UN07408